jgi:hypothetical protein
MPAKIGQLAENPPLLFRKSQNWHAAQYKIAATQPANVSLGVFSNSDPPTMNANDARIPRTIENKTLATLFINVSSRLTTDDR